MTAFPPNQNVPPDAFEPRRTSFSTGLAVLGILGIVLGILGVLSNVVCGVGMMITAMLVEDFIPEEFTGGIPEGGMAIATLALSVVNGIVSLLLLMAGIGVMRRRPAGIRLYKLWAILRIIFVLIGVPITFYVQMTTLQAQAEMEHAVALPPLLIALPTAIFGLLWGSWLPVFALFWLQRQAVVDEVAQWISADESTHEHTFGQL